MDPRGKTRKFIFRWRYPAVSVDVKPNLRNLCCCWWFWELSQSCGTLSQVWRCICWLRFAPLWTDSRFQNQACHACITSSYILNGYSWNREQDSIIVVARRSCTFS